MGEMAALIKKHPELIGILVIAVIIIAYLQSRSGGGGAAPSGDVTFTGGGVAPLPIDPNVAAIQEAQIGANSANLSTLSQTLLGMNEAAYARDVAEGQTSAALSSSLAQTEAQRTVGLAQVESQTTIARGQTAAQIEQARISANEQFNAAAITSTMQANAESAQLAAIELENQRQLEINATQRDIARVQSKSGFWKELIGGATGVIASIFG